MLEVLMFFLFGDSMVYNSILHKYMDFRCYIVWNIIDKIDEKTGLSTEPCSTIE